MVVRDVWARYRSRVSQVGHHVPVLERRCICDFSFAVPLLALETEIVLGFAVFVAAILTVLPGALAELLRILGGRVVICIKAGM